MGLVSRQIARSPLVCLTSPAPEPSFFPSGCQRTIFETSSSLFPESLECGAGSLGVSVAAVKFQGSAFSDAKVTAAIERATALGNNYLAADLVLAAIEARNEIGSDVFVKEVLIPEVDFPADMPNAARIHFQDCIFSLLELDPEADARVLPRFQQCFVGTLEGRVSEADLPSGVFHDCVFDAFLTGAGTTNQVLDLELPIGIRVLITVLKKLFERKGRGRKENALYRGLDHRARRIVPDVLQLLKSNAIAFPCRRGMDTIWLPDRSARGRAGKIVSSPSAKDDPLIVSAARLE